MQLTNVILSALYKTKIYFDVYVECEIKYKERRDSMKRNRLMVIVMCLLFASIMIIQVSAAERSYFGGCNDCGNHVTAKCAGVVSVVEKSHKYNTILGFFGNTCLYDEHTHATTETCKVYSSHVNPGDNVTAYTGHTYDDLGKNACGEEDITPCALNAFAYDSSK